MCSWFHSFFGLCLEVIRRQRRDRMQKGAVFDPTRLYRYSLWREWSTNHPQITFIMLNPSTADDQRDDPTIRRCIGFAQAWEFGCLEVVNLFAYRATYPFELLKVADPIGAENDHFLLQAIRRSACTVAAWGVHGTLFGRSQQVLRLLTSCPDIHCLGFTKDGHPRHPLYIQGDTRLVTLTSFRQ